jgi:hypothetical protein
MPLTTIMGGVLILTGIYMMEKNNGGKIQAKNK